MNCPQEVVAVAAFCDHIVERAKVLQQQSQHVILGLAVGSNALTWSPEANCNRYSVEQLKDLKEADDIKRFMKR